MVRGTKYMCRHMSHSQTKQNNRGWPLAVNGKFHVAKATKYGGAKPPMASNHGPYDWSENIGWELLFI